MNIYIDALKFAETKGENLSVSYSETVIYLTSKGYKIEDEFEEYFLFWFFENFYEKYSYSTIKNGTTGQVNNLPLHLRNCQNKKYFMTANGFSTLQEFYKLEQARSDSKRANVLAKLALFITIVVGLIQIWLQIKCN
jgi:hypothetical protein